MIIQEVVTVYRAPFPGAQRRLSRISAARDWARFIVKDARCRGGECSVCEPEVGWPGDQCDRHGAGYARLVNRLARRLARIVGVAEGRE